MIMFTGIVEELGEVVAVDHGLDSVCIGVRAALVTTDAIPGASVAVNGVCLTVVEVADGVFTSDVMRETLQRSSLGTLAVGSAVNLERAVRVADRLGGHIVQGHVDGVGTVISRVPGDRWEIVRMSLPGELSRYVVEKGSIAVDGVSLTVSAIGDGWFEVSLIPTTLATTTLGRRRPGEKVNLEVDVIAKYVERLMSRQVSAR
jgi:riboflavin synthase